MLKSAGFAVRAFNSADEFLEYERPLGNDCVVVDIHMPGMDGLQLKQKLNLTHPELPVVLVTGDISKSAKNSPGQLGAELLEKPFEDQTLFDWIELAMRKSQSNKMAD